MQRRPSGEECADLISKFKLEGHLNEPAGDGSYQTFYKQRLEEMEKMLGEIPLVLEFQKFEIERLEEVCYSGIKGFGPLRNYIKVNKPKEVAQLDEETIDRGTWAFVHLIVDKYLKREPHNLKR